MALSHQDTVFCFVLFFILFFVFLFCFVLFCFILVFVPGVSLILIS